MSSIVVHHLERSRSHRVLWLLEELELDYELEIYARDPRTMRAPPELSEVHPLGRSPTVVVDGEVLAESGAILEFFTSRQGSLRPGPDEPEAQRFRFWMHYAEGSVMPPLLVALILSQIRTAKVPFFVKPIAKQIASKVHKAYSGPEIQRHFNYIESELANRTWFLGDHFSAADIQMSYPLESGLTRGRLGDLPHIEAWLERARARPAYQRAVDRGGPNTMPGAER